MYLSKNNRSPFYQIVYLSDDGTLTTKSTGTKFKAEALKYLSEFEKRLYEAKKFPPIKFLVCGFFLYKLVILNEMKNLKKMLNKSISA